MVAARLSKASALFALLVSLGLRAGAASPVQVSAAAQQGVSPPLFLIPPASPVRHVDHPPRPIPRPKRRLAPVRDAALQRSSLSLLAPPTATTFEATGQGFTGPDGIFSVDAMPPDSDGDVGPNHYVSIVNSGFSVLRKTDGAVLLGPLQTNSLFSSLGGQCATQNDGDGIVLYDPLADRWFLTQFAVSGPKFFQCVAVSKTADPTGQWFVYAFVYANFPDYGKFGVWPDGYYATYNMFDAVSQAFTGAQVCVFDRARMLLGQPATQQCVQLSVDFGGLLPTDLDGHTPPPAGEPNFILGFGTDVLQFWKFHVDWRTPANTSLSAERDLPVAAFTQACAATGTCIVQKPPATGANEQLDSLADRMMFRLAYRNFGDHESLVTNHTVVAGSSTGVRWYELRNPNAAAGPAVYQQGTFAPDASFRWMGSIAMDGSGDLAVGYSISSSTLFPSLAYAGRLAADPLGQMAQGESQMFAGTGSQQGNDSHGVPITRWGDYSNMSVDPSDDCTFWYVGEYLATTGDFNWHERVGKFRFPGCGVVAKGFSLALSPGAQTVAPGASVTYAVSSAALGGSTAPITLSVGALPAGLSGSFDTTSIAPGGSATLTVTADPATANTPASTFTVSGASTDHTAAASASISVSATGLFNTFSIAAAPLSNSLRSSGTATYTISTAVTAGAAESVALSLGVLPAGITGSFNPAAVTAGGKSTLTLTSSSAAAGSNIFTVFGDAASDSESADAAVVVSANDFGISLAPLSRSILAGHSDTYTVTTTLTAGAAENIQLDVADLPPDITGTFDKTTIAAGQSAILTLDVLSTAAPLAASTFTVTGTSDSLVVHAATASVAIVAAPSSDFTLALSPSSATLFAGRSQDFAVATTATTGTAETITLSATGLPAQVTAAFSPATVTAGGSATLTLTAGSTTAAGAATVTVTGTAPSATHSATASLTTVLAPPPPTVAIHAPVSGALVANTVSINVTASAGAGTTLSAIEVSIDGGLIDNFTTSPVTITWDTTKGANGQHTISARATDATGGSTAATPVVVTVANVAAPVVSISAPGAGTTVSGTIPVSATTSGTGVNQVSILLDGATQIGIGAAAALTVQWDTSTVSDGPHSLSARATDTSGHDVTSTEVTLTVSNAAAKRGGCASSGVELAPLGLLLLGALRGRRR